LRTPSSQVEGLQYNKGGLGVFAQDFPEGSIDEQSPMSTALGRSPEASQAAEWNDGLNERNGHDYQLELYKKVMDSRRRKVSFLPAFLPCLLEFLP
jgi:hypothetical protein